MRLNELVDIVKYVYNDAFKEQPVDTKKLVNISMRLNIKTKKSKPIALLVINIV